MRLRRFLQSLYDAQMFVHGLQHCPVQAVLDASLDVSENRNKCSLYLLSVFCNSSSLYALVSEPVCTREAKNVCCLFFTSVFFFNVSCGLGSKAVLVLFGKADCECKWLFHCLAASSV